MASSISNILNDEIFVDSPDVSVDMVEVDGNTFNIARSSASTESLLHMAVKNAGVCFNIFFTEFGVQTHFSS